MNLRRVPVSLLCFVALSGCAGGGTSSGEHFDSNALVASTQPGMGAVPYDGGVTFRTWAPSASHVYVAGDFNGWNPTEMGNEFNGNFSMDYAGATAGQQYKFQITNAASGDTFYRVDPRAQEVVNSAGNGIIHDRNSYSWQHDLDFDMPPWNEQVIYELHVGTFFGSNGGLGDFDSTAQKLSYLQWLGINVIELMPCNEFPGTDSAGYNPADPFAPATQYGSADDMKSLIDQAHSYGIAVILDITYNHLGPSDLPLWQYDGTSYGNLPDGNDSGGIYFYADYRAETPWGDTRPDYGRQQVQDYIRDNVLQWVNEYHVDGMRIDAPEYMSNQDGTPSTPIPDGWNMEKEISDAVHQSSPWKIMIAEDLQDNSSVTQPTSSGGAGFDVQWESEFVHPIQSAVETSSDSDVDIGSVAYAVGHNYNGDAYQRVIYSESHDEVSNGKERIPTAVGGWDAGGYFAQKKSTLAAAVMMMSPGRPMLFMGQEFLTPGYFQSDVTLDWSLCNTYPGILQLYQDLVHLRRNWADNVSGLKGTNLNIFHQDNNGKVIAFHRWMNGGPQDDVVVVANFSNTTFTNYYIGLPRAGLWQARFNSDSSAYSSLFDNTFVTAVQTNNTPQDGLGYNGGLNLGPYSVVVLSQDN